MKILLIRPSMKNLPVPPPYAPLGLLYLASVLEMNDFEVKLIDLNIQDEGEIWSEIADAEIIGISMLPQARSQAYQLIREIRKTFNEDKKIVLGGPFVTSMANQLIERFPIDAVVLGEGETALVTMCDRWRNNLKVENGLYQGYPLDIDTIPFPAWKHTNFDWWKMQIAQTRPDWAINGVRIGNARWSPIIASRGCYGRCIFCNIYRHWNYMVRFRSGLNIADEIEELVKRYNVTLFSFDDDAFPINKEQCMDFCQEIMRRELKIAWKADTRADGVDRDMLVEMKKAGCFMLAMGVESGSPKILATIKKGLDLDRARRMIADMHEVGIISFVLLMLGNPGETEETVKETMAFLEETRPNIHVHVRGVMVLPGTEMQKIAEVPDEYYLEEGKDGVPFYLKEHTMEELNQYSAMLQTIPTNY